MIIFSPGPANISSRVRRSLLKPDICHRDTEFTDIFSNTRSLIKEIFCLKGSYEVVFFGGSGTAAIDSVISSFGGYKKKLLIISNGIYGERASSIARIYNIDFDEINFGWGNQIDLIQIEDALRSRKFGALYFVHHETTTGILNPLKEISKLAKKYDNLVLVDAVSSLAGEEFDIEELKLDAVIASSNKCIRAIPGISFVIASNEFINNAGFCKSGSFYTSFKGHFDMELKGQTPFTPPVQTFYALEEALKELKQETLSKRIKGFSEITNLLRNGLEKLGIEYLIPRALMSNTMTVIKTPKGKTYEDLHREFKKHGFVIYSSQGKLAGHTFRLGTVGLISKKDIKGFLSVFKGLL